MKSASPVNSVNLVSPMPPVRNGIADYAYMIAGELQNYFEVKIFSENMAVKNPPGTKVFDWRQIFRYGKDDVPHLYQIGNNKDHRYCLTCLRNRAGVVTLHDLQLLYLYEISEPKEDDLARLMRRTDPTIGHQWASHWRDNGIKTSANYVLFDMVGDIVDNASRVIVHSRFAANKIRAIYGADVADRTVVIPHFAPTIDLEPRARSKRKLGFEADDLLIVTSGFASKAKRLDWVIECLSEVARRGHKFRWIHAGEERENEFALSAAISAEPYLKGKCYVTGFLSADVLDSHIAAADIVLNLRYPSVGESSGTLARAFAAGACCVVSDTAAYVEIPRNCVVHTSVFNPIPSLVAALEGLIKSPEVRRYFGDNARRWAVNDLSIQRIANTYAETLRDSLNSRSGEFHYSAANSPKTAEHDILIDCRVGDWRSLLNAKTSQVRKAGKFRMLFKNVGELLQETSGDAILFERLNEIGLTMKNVSIIKDENASVSQVILEIIVMRER
jgi:glycosyltransferase involved in cell wall biosynthesis